MERQEIGLKDRKEFKKKKKYRGCLFDVLVSSSCRGHAIFSVMFQFDYMPEAKATYSSFHMY